MKTQECLPPVFVLDADAFLAPKGVLRNMALPRLGFFTGTIGFGVIGTLSTSSLFAKKKKQKTKLID